MNILESRLNENTWRRITIILLAVGAVLRLVQYLANRSLWLDEVYLAQNIIARSFDGLTRPLALDQTAPILFLFAEKFSVLIGDTSEYALRFVPLVSGIAALFLFYLVARYLLADGYLAFAVLLFAISEPLVYYATEVKQYSSDVLVALAIMYLALRARFPPANAADWKSATEKVKIGSKPIERSSTRFTEFSPDEPPNSIRRRSSIANCPSSPTESWNSAAEKVEIGPKPIDRVSTSVSDTFATSDGVRWLALIAFGAIAIWVSDPSIFILATIGIALVWDYWREGREKILLVALGGIVWFASFAALYVVRLGGVGSNALLQNYWQDYFVPLPPKSFSQLRLIGDLIGNTFTFVFPPFPTFAELGVGIGAVVAFRQKKLWLLLAPLLFALLASGLHLYPFYERFLLFAVPALIILAALGVAAVGRVMTTPQAKFAFVVALSAITFPAVLDASLAVVHPYVREEVRPVIQYMLSHRREGDQLFAYYSASEPLDYYLREFHTRIDFARGANARSDWFGYLRDLDRWRGKGRVWFLFSHVQRSDGVDEEQLFVRYLDTLGRQMDKYQQPGASVYLYDLK